MHGFLTWGAEINLRGCWGRPHMWWSKVCPWAFLYFLIVFVNATRPTINAVFWGGMNQAYGQELLQFSLIYPYSNQVLANGRGCWTA